MRDKVVFLLPFIQVIIALITLSKIPEPPPQYFCTQPDPYTPLIICNPS